MIHLIEQTESTNKLALEASAAVHGETWIADYQTAGRGRREVGGDRRAWFSPAGRNIYMSVLLRPSVPPSEVAGVTLAVGAHVCTALFEQSGLEQLWLKWPNDIWSGNRKVAGILTEARTGARGMEAVVVGIGINVNLDTHEIPEELEEIMTSLRIESGAPLDRLNIAFAVRRAVLAGAAEYFGGGWVAVRDDITRWDRSHGRTVDVELNGATVRGTARGIDPSGGLVVDVDGTEHILTAGDVRFRT